MEEEIKNQSRKIHLKPLVAGLLIFVIGFYFGLNTESETSKVQGIENKENPEEITTDFYPFWKVWNLIDEKYVAPDLEKHEASSEERVWGAISGMVDSLGDPNTIFLVPEEKKVFEEEISGNFEGVGMEVGIRDGILTVIAPLKDTPAYRAGIKAGDKIFKIDGKETLDLNVDEAVRLIRGKEGTEVTLTVFRDGQKDSIEIVIKRGVIDIPVSDSEWRDNIFIFRLYNFSANSNEAFREAIRSFINSKKENKKMILDLRGNPGGFLSASVDIASWFLESGKVVVKEDFGDKQEDVVHRSRGHNVFGKDFEMIVLIDAGSASASEILAGALQEYGIAKLVGEKSFGKGSVQELVSVTPNTSLKVTVARWITPQGHSISLEGLTPDVEVELTEADFEDGKDPVLDKALEMLR